MKHGFKTTIMATIACAAVLTQCGKEGNYIRPGKPSPVSYLTKYTVNAPDLQSLQLSELPSVQTFTIDVTKPGEIVCNGMTRVAFEPGSFLLNGLPVRAGVVKVEVRELYNKSAMIASGITTQTADALLESTGMIELKASTNDQALTIDPSRPLQVSFPLVTRTGATDFGTFYMDAPGAVWKPANEQGDTLFFNDGNSIPFRYIRIRVRRFGWINCDRFLNYKNCHDIKVELDDSMMKDCKVYVVVRSLRNAAMLYPRTDSNYFGIQHRGYRGFPDTFLVTVVAEGVHNRMFYAADTTLRVAAGTRFKMRPALREYTEFKSWLATIFDE